MPLIREEDKKYLIQEFEKHLKDDVDLVVFTSEDADCKYCKESNELAEEVAEVDGKIHLVKYDFDKDKEIAKEYGVDKYPTTVVAKHGVRDGR
nr:thioredoxin domain-containing protein [Thermoplasmatales archaeon]